MNLAGAVVLVTGASSGIGRSAAKALADRGSRLLVSGRDQVALESVAAECGGDALPADLGDSAGCTDLAKRALEAHGQVDVLVASAGIGSAGPFHQVPEESIVDLVQVNLVAPLLLARALLPGMLQRRRGHLSLVGSIAGLTGVAGEAVYAATKAGISIFVDSLALECHGTGVEISTVVPGVVRTAFFDRRGVPYGRRYPRPVSPERIAEAIVDGIETGRTEKIVPRWLSLAPMARGLSPSGYRQLARRFGNN